VAAFERNRWSSSSVRTSVPEDELSAYGALGRKILKREHVWLGAGEKFVHFAEEIYALCGNSLRSSIHKVRGSFEDGEGEAS